MTMLRIFVDNNTVRIINASDFLTMSDPLTLDITHQHIRLGNDTLLRRVQPYPKLKFADFRGNKLYIKVRFWVY